MGHVVPGYVLVAVFATLIVLTLLTVSTAAFGLGRLEIWASLGIATAKAGLVVLYFMHLRYDHPFNGLVFVTGLGFVALFLGLTLTDADHYQPSITDYVTTKSQP